MKIIKKSIVILFTALSFISISVTAFAAGGTPQTVADQSHIEQGKGKNCRLKFSLTDKTNGIFTDEITITFMDIETNEEYNFTMTSADYLFGITVGGNVRYGEYNIALDYAGKDQFVIQNADGTAITSVSANSENIDFDWVVFDKNDSKSEGQATNENVAAQLPEDEAAQDVGGETSASQFMAKTGNTDADSVWNNFINSVSVLETDDKYAAIVKYYDTTKENFARNYVKVNEDKTEDDYLNMTPFERFLWYATYVEPVMATTYSDYDTYLGTIDKWNSNVAGNAYNLLKNQGAVEQAEAYKTLMEWQYNYLMENGAIYNFMTGKTSIEENSNLKTVSPDSADGNNGDPTDKEIQSLIDEENQSIKNNNTENDTGIWSKTLNLIKNNAVMIVILLILAGTTIGIVIYRKHKAIDGDE